MPEADVICSYCFQTIHTDKVLKPWAWVGDKYYHFLCIRRAMEESAKWKQVENVFWNGKYLATTICDVWICNLCGCYGSSYGVERCPHCNSPAHYGSDNGHYTTSDQVWREVDGNKKNLQETKCN